MPKKTNSRTADGGQSREGSYSLGAPQLQSTDSGVVVTIHSTAYTVLGESFLSTAVSSVDGDPDKFVDESLKAVVLRAIETARLDAEAVIQAVEAEWDANVGGSDDADDEDEGLREGPVVGGAPATDPYAPDALLEAARARLASAELALTKAKAKADGRKGGFFNGMALAFAEREHAEAKKALAREEAFQAVQKAEVDIKAGFVTLSELKATPTLAELKRRKAHAEGLVRELDAASARKAIEARLGIIHGDDEISIPNAEYAELLADRRRLEALQVQAVGISPSNAFERPVPEDANAAPAGEIDIATFVAATTGADAAFDVSNASQDDGGPVEAGLDIDALVAGVDVQRDTCSLDIRAVRSGEYPQLTVTVTGPGSGELVRQLISDIHFPSLTEPLVNASPVNLHVGGRCFEGTSLDPKADAETFQRVVGAAF